MKKSLVFLFVVGVLLCCSPALAEDDVDDETLEEAVAVADSNHGAMMRMLQLARAIERRAMWGEEIIEVLSQKGEDVDRLEAIVDELGLLADEAAGADISDLDLAVENFLAIKADAKTLIKEFREIAGGLLTEEDKSQLRARWAEIDRTEVQQYNERIREARRNLNAERVNRMLQAMNREDSELVEGVRNGQVSTGQVRQRVVEHYRVAVGERAEIRQQFRTNVQASVAERVEARQSAVTSYVQNRISNIQQRAEVRQARLTGNAA